MSEEIKITTANPKDAWDITNVLYKTWIDTYPNEEFGITKEDIEESFKKSFTQESIAGLANKIASNIPNEKRLVARKGNNIVGRE